MKVIYFASLKESLNLACEHIATDTVITIKELKAILVKKHGTHHFKKNIICAVNHTVIDDNIKLNNNDEVAFYPPVSGG